MTGIAASQANAALDAIRTDTPYVQLHVGDPGAAGTANKATEVTRKAVTFSAASGGVMTNSAQVQWTNIAGSQDATHFTVWRGSGAATDGTGTFAFSGTITANPYTAGDTYTAAVSAITLTVTAAA
jgi:hypothetical protein